MVAPLVQPEVALHAVPARRGRIILDVPGARDGFPSVARAIELARERVPFALVLPTRSALEHAKNEVARRAGAVDPGAFFTILGLGKRVLGASHASRVASLRERDAVLEGALCDPPGDADARSTVGTELARAARFRGFRQALLHLFSELEGLGFDPRALEGALRRSRGGTARSAAVHARIATAFRAYRAALDRRGLVVEADLLGRAARVLERGRSGIALLESSPVVLVDGFVDLAPRQLELVLALAARARDTEVFWPAAGPRATEGPLAALVGEGFTLVAPPDVSPAERPGAAGGRAPAIDHVVRQAFSGSARRDATDGAVSFVRAGSPEDEAACALRIAREAVLDRPNAADARRAWNDVLVVVPDARTARASFERTAARLGVPVRVHAPRTLVESPLVRGALAFVRAAATLEPGPLLAAAAAPAVGLDPDLVDGFARAVRRRGSPSGAGAFEQLADRTESGVHPRARAFLVDVLALARALAAAEDAGRALEAVGAALASRLRAPALAALGAEPSEDELAAAADETAARTALLALVGELAPLFAGRASTPLALAERLDAEAAGTDYLPRDRRRHVVHVVDVSEARSWRAPVVVVAGLSEGRFPRPWRSDVLLDEPARRAVTRGRSARLATAEDHLERERFLFVQALACARERLHLLHAAFDDRGEPCPASPFLTAVEALFTPEALSAARVKRSPADLVPQTLADVTTLDDARRFAFVRTAASFRPGSEGARRARHAAALLELIAARAGEHDRLRRAVARPGWALAHGPGFRALDRVYSASELEAFAFCPYKHFVQYVLGARRRDDLAVTGLDARLQGKIVHAALQRAHERGETPEQAFDGAFLEVAKDLPLGPDEEAFRRAARLAVAAFLREDDPEFLARTGLTVARVEVAFGPGGAHGPLEIDDPILGGAIRLEGRIDRVDEGDRGAFVTDYKLGKDELDARAREAMARGERLQLQVYLLAVAKVLGKTPLGASLVALRSRRRTGIVHHDSRDLCGAGRSFVLAPVDVDRLLAEAEESIREIVRAIGRGVIDPLPRSAKDCRRCDVRDACRFRERPPQGGGA